MAQDGQTIVTCGGVKETREAKKEDFILVRGTEAATSRLAVTAAGNASEDIVLAALAVDIAGNGAAEEPR